jgi:anti-sigma factor RsiW
MTMFNTVENWALHAFADGELEGEEKHAVEKLLVESEDARKALANIRYQKSELYKAFGKVVDEPVPAALLAAVRGSGGRSWRYAAMAAAVALVTFGSFGTYYMLQSRESFAAADLAHRALVAHEVYSVEVRHPVEIAAAERVELQNWLTKRLGTDIAIPTLDYDGYEFLGGRLLAGESSPAGQLMYETSDKQRLTVFIAANADGKDEALRLVAHGNTITCYWRDGKLALAVTGEMPNAEMMDLAKNIYDQMEGKG